MRGVICFIAFSEFANLFNWREGKIHLIRLQMKNFLSRSLQCISYEGEVKCSILDLFNFPTRVRRRSMFTRKPNSSSREQSPMNFRL